MPETFSIILDTALILGLTVVGLLEIHPVWKWSSFVAVTCFVLVISYLFLQNFGLFLDFFFPLLILGAHTGFEHWRESNHRTQPVH